MNSLPYPDDENGEVLQALAEQGVDLTVVRNVEFAHLFPNPAAAQDFANRAEPLGFRARIYEPDAEDLEDGMSGWDVICAREIVPTHPNITRYESQLARLARQCGGREDGWGFLDG